MRTATKKHNILDDGQISVSAPVEKRSRRCHPIDYEEGENLVACLPAPFLACKNNTNVVEVRICDRYILELAHCYAARIPIVIEVTTVQQQELRVLSKVQFSTSVRCESIVCLYTMASSPLFDTHVLQIDKGLMHYYFVLASSTSYAYRRTELS